MALFPRALLLLQHGIEDFALGGIENRPELLPGVLQFLVQERGDGFHELASVLLAFGEDSIDFLALFVRKVEITFHPAQELESNAVGGERGKGLSRVRGILARGFLWVRFDSIRVTNEETTGHHAGAEDEHRGEDDFPGVHQVVSTG